MRASGRGLGHPIVCAHKGVTLPGLGFDEQRADPKDVGPAAKNHPDITFIVYHSGYEVGYTESPYDPENPNPRGIVRLIRTVEQNDLKGKNVYADLGVAWALGMANLAHGARLRKPRPGHARTNDHRASCLPLAGRELSRRHSGPPVRGR
jgi:hypothetical protein